MSLGKTLTNLRRAANLTQGELGERLNVSAQAVSKWENDISEPDISTIKRIADIYGVSVSDIIEAVPEKETKSAKAKRLGRYDIVITSVHDNAASSILAHNLETVYGGTYFSWRKKLMVLPAVISGMVEEDEANKIKEILGSDGVTLSLLPATGDNEYIKPKSNPHNSLKMGIRFVGANVYSLFAAVLVFSLFHWLLLAWLKDVLNYSFSIGLAVIAFTTVFQLQYPTFTRKMIVGAALLDKLPDWLEEMPVLDFLAALVYAILFIPMCVVLIVCSPVDYALSIKKRILRIKKGDLKDHVFMRYFEGE